MFKMAARFVVWLILTTSFHFISQSVRLAGGAGDFEGRVEIFYSVEQEWGTVCDDLWGDSDARVVCSQLGYEGGIAMPEAHFGEGSGTIWLDSVECVGNEDYLSDCGHSEWGQHDCTHAEDASVICGKLRNYTPSLWNIS